MNCTTVAIRSNQLGSLPLSVISQIFFLSFYCCYTHTAGEDVPLLIHLFIPSFPDSFNSFHSFPPFFYFVRFLHFNHFLRFLHFLHFVHFLHLLHSFISLISSIAFIAFIAFISFTVFHSFIPSFVPSFIFLHSRNSHWSVSQSSTCSFLSQLKAPSKMFLRIFDHPQMAGMHIQKRKPSSDCGNHRVAAPFVRIEIRWRTKHLTLFLYAASHSGHRRWNPKSILENMIEINRFQTLVRKIYDRELKIWALCHMGVNPLWVGLLVALPTGRLTFKESTKRWPRRLWLKCLGRNPSGNYF